MTVEGIDAAWDRPTVGQLAAAGKHFIVGYVSRDPSKNITRAECDAAHAAGIAVCLVWETTSDRALSGAAGGREDRPEARRQAAALGFPADRPIYTAVDFDATAAQLSASVGPYLRAFAPAAVLGVYGGLRTVGYVFDHGLAAFGWQTYAWSGGVWDPRVQVRQYSNGVHIAGHDTDLDRAYATDFGQWPAPGTTSQGEITMAGFDAGDAHFLLTYQGLPATNPVESLGSAVLATQRDAAAAAALGSKLDALAAQIAALPAAIADAVVKALPPSSGVTTGTDVQFTGTAHLGAPAA